MSSSIQIVIHISTLHARKVRLA